MTYKQEPCPLCGRDMTAIETYPGRGELYCGHCDLTIGGNDAKTPEELVALMDGSEHRRLKAENAKLREFAQTIAEVACEGQMLCDGCRFFRGCYNGGKKEHEGRGCQWLLWVRELGIEVEDA